MNAPVLKTGKLARASGVRISPSPPRNLRLPAWRYTSLIRFGRRRQNETRNPYRRRTLGSRGSGVRGIRVLPALPHLLALERFATRQTPRLRGVVVSGVAQTRRGCGSFGPGLLGLGLDTATTSATFFPQFEQRMRSASSLASPSSRPGAPKPPVESLRRRRSRKLRGPRRFQNCDAARTFS